MGTGGDLGGEALLEEVSYVLLNNNLLLAVFCFSLLPRCHMQAVFF